MDLQPAQEVPRLFGRERLVERSGDMRIEVVTDQDHLLCIGIVLFEKMLHLMRPILLGSRFSYCYPAPLSQRLGEDEPTGDPVSPVLIVLPFRTTGLRRDRFPHLGMQLDRLFVHADDRVYGIIRSLVDLQHVFHRGDEVPVFGGGNNPLLFGMWLERVFLASARVA